MSLGRRIKTFFQSLTIFAWCDFAILNWPTLII
jgi:hypothetical protein